LEIIHNIPSYNSLPTPAFSTIRGWILKLGLFNLTKPCEQGEWVWIVDCSIQMGAMKCLLILGIRMETLKERKDFTLSHIDVTPIVLKTVESCRGEIVKAALEEAKSKTGISAAIVSDQGPELKRGVRLFVEDQVGTQKPPHLNDIMHKADLALKKELESDSEWINFTKELQNTTQRLKQTSSSHLIPPKQHQKKRRMRSEVSIIQWGIKIIHYLDQGKANKLEEKQLSWVVKYRDQLTIYQEMAIYFDMCVEEIRKHGYSWESIKVLKEKEKAMFCSNRSKIFFSKLLEIIEKEVSKIPFGSYFVGCTFARSQWDRSLPQIEASGAGFSRDGSSDFSLRDFGGECQRSS
jgi:hypothetical protein